MGRENVRVEVGNGQRVVDRGNGQAKQIPCGLLRRLHRTEYRTATTNRSHGRGSLDSRTRTRFEIIQTEKGELSHFAPIIFRSSFYSSQYTF